MVVGILRSYAYGAEANNKFEDADRRSKVAVAELSSRYRWSLPSSHGRYQSFDSRSIARDWDNWICNLILSSPPSRPSTMRLDVLKECCDVSCAF